ncbi:hypothetical protein ACIRRH_07840 [Kitasatospora sp. NPDC101235]|uniref:hypothetical protein n=1 Tax=Kitasatospora sp. NPDC101235 TaxID=3364101 RepID=UPI00382E593B
MTVGRHNGPPKQREAGVRRLDSGESWQPVTARDVDGPITDTPAPARRPTGRPRGH